jgi:uncharacterized membrane-anchored protein
MGGAASLRFSRAQAVLGEGTRVYLPGKDKAAAYGLTGLIVGAAATKAGFFKLLLGGILAFKKFIVVGVIALGVALKRFFVRKQAEAPAETT